MVQEVEIEAAAVEQQEAIRASSIGSKPDLKELQAHGKTQELTHLPMTVEEATVEQEEYDEEELPTEEEIRTLRRVPGKIPPRIYFIAYVELVERLSFYGCSQVFVNFIQQPRPTPTGAALDPNSDEAQPGALGLGQQASTGLSTFNSFWNYFMPLFGAYVSDTYLGRFKTIWMSVCVSIAGHIILTSSAAPSVLDDPKGGLAAFIIGILVIGVGTGGFKPNISPLIAEQVKWHKLKIRVTKKGERVVVDPAVTVARIYNWFYLFINIGALIGQITMSYAERYVGFYLSYLLPTCVFVTALPVLFLSRSMYNRRPPEGSVLGPAVKLLIRGSKGRWHLNPIQTYKHLNDGTYWEDLKPSHMDPSTRPGWMTFDDSWVDEVSRGWSSCQVFLWYPLWWLCYNQLTTNLISQAATMNLNGVPNDVVSNLDPFALIIFIPICDLFIYPALRKANIRFTPIKKITFGFYTGGAAMIWAAIVQLYIYRKSPCGRQASTCEVKPGISVWAQTGSYVLIALSEIFASITSLEYGFSKAPKNMRSLVASFALFMSAISYALGEAWLPLVVDPHIVWNYGSVAIIAFVVGTAFWFFNRGLDKEEDRLNQLATGNMHGNRVKDIEQPDEPPPTEISEKH